MAKADKGVSRNNKKICDQGLQNFTIVTANVGTLRPKEAKGKKNNLTLNSKQITNRTLEFDLSFQQAQFDLICLQETRIGAAGVVQLPSYTCYRSAATPEGWDGSQVWLRQGAGPKVTSSRAISARTTTVIMRSGDLTATIVSTHGPIEDSAAEAKQSFYEELEGVLEEARRNTDLTIMGVDMNGTLGSVLGEEVGPHRPEQETENGMMLRNMMQQFELYAANTFEGGDYTWTGTRGHRRRIDYICISRWAQPFLQKTWVADEPVLAPATREDHRAVCVQLNLLAAKDSRQSFKKPEVRTKRQKPLTIDPTSLADPAARCNFAWRIGQHCVDEKAGVDEEVQRWTEKVKEAAEASFEMRKPRKGKQWLSEECFVVMDQVSDLRKGGKAKADTLRCAAAKYILCIWGHVAKQVKAEKVAKQVTLDHTNSKFDIHMQGAEKGGGAEQPQIIHAAGGSCISDISLGRLWVARSLWHSSCLVAAEAHHALQKMIRWKATVLRKSRRQSYQRTAAYAQCASDSNDTSKLFKIVKRMAGQPPNPHKGIKHEDGHILTEQTEIEQRWKRHYCEVLAATDTGGEAKCAAGKPLDVISDKLNFAHFLKMVRKLNGDKAVGPDGITAHLLQAAVGHSARHLLALSRMAYSSGTYPTQWR